MYFMLAEMHERFHLLSYGLAIVLVFIGTKMLLLDIYKIPVSWSLGFTVVVLVLTMFLSLKIPPKKVGAQSAYPFAAKRDDIALVAARVAPRRWPEPDRPVGQRTG